MIRYFCDRCGKVLSDSEELYFLSIEKNHGMAELKTGHLCEKCIEDLKAWLQCGTEKTDGEDNA